MRNRAGINFKKFTNKLEGRYVLVTGVLFVLLITGQNMSGLKEFTRVQEAEKNRRIVSQFTISSDQVTLDAKNKQYKYDGFPVLEKGGAYRLLFDIGSDEEIFDGPAVGRSEDTKADTTVKVTGFGASTSGSPVVSLSLPTEQDYQAREVYIKPSDALSELVFERDLVDTSVRVYVRNVRVIPVRSSSLSDIAPTVLGNTNFAPTLTIDTGNLKRARTFTHTNQFVGDVFTASDDYLSGVGLCVRVRGNGGNGGYQLQLRKVSTAGRVDTAVMAAFDFVADEMAYYAKRGTDSIGSCTVYHLPLASFLVPGEHYAVGISNSGVEFNVLNTLELFGSASLSDNGLTSGVSIVSGNEDRFDPLYMVPYGATMVREGGVRIPTGATIQDMGDGTLLYQYQNNQWFSDLLDLDRDAMVSKEPAGEVFFDTVRNSVVATAKNSMEIIYSFPVPRPMTNVQVKGEGIRDGVAATYSYSFDGTTWTPIGQSLEENGTPVKWFSLSIDHDQLAGKNRQSLYIKVGYRPNDTDKDHVPIFGLQTISVSAILSK